jgi:outer membrane protein assembly factor BamB
MLKRFLLVTISFLCAATAPRAGDWTQFRGPNGTGRADAKDLPLTWSDTENVRWKTAVHGKGWSSPVVWGDQVWLTTADEEGTDPKGKDRVLKGLFAVCVDRKSGQIVHDLKLFAPKEPGFCIPFNSFASPTPVIEKGRVYVHFGSNGTACLNTANGKVLWDRTDLKCDHFRGAGSSPILYKNLLILIFDGYDFNYVVALDKENGKTVWKKDRNIAYTSKDGDYHKAYATPAVIEVDGKPQLVCPSAEATIAYDPATGDELWRIMHGGMNAAMVPQFGHGMYYLTSGHTKLLLAVKPGKGMLADANVSWKTNKGVPTRPSLLLIDDLIFMISDDGIASCVEAKTGDIVWKERLGGEYSASPLYADGRIYACEQGAADKPGSTFVLEAGRKFKVLATNPLPDGCMASPIAVDKSLFVRTKTTLYCLEKK